MQRWNAVHAELAKVIRAVRPGIKVSFQSSPAVDLWMNPWYSAVDLAAMARDLDSISTDPYYTFHRRIFDPAEVYLSEWSRFLAGIVPEGKQAGIIPQAFSHPTFTRPLNEADGIWSAIVPPACGVTFIAPYTYTLQRCSPVQKAYESCFGLDSYLEKTVPLAYAGIVHGLKSEVFKFPMRMETPDSYDGTRLFPVAAALRHGGVPYGFVADQSLERSETMTRFQVVVFPEIACMSEQERQGVGDYIRAGGNAIILGGLGEANETGENARRSLLAELFDLTVGEVSRSAQAFRLTSNNPAAKTLEYPDPEAARRYMDGTMAPLFTLSHTRNAIAPRDARVLARFKADGNPAILSFHRYGGRVVWFAGFPTRTTQNARYGTTVLNQAHPLFARLTEWAAGRKPVLRVGGWPPKVPMRELRPLDRRFMPTFEFFPLRGEDCFLGVVTSYLREPTSFPMTLEVPEGRRLKRVVELLSRRRVPFRLKGTEATIKVQPTFDTPAFVYLFELE
jgi:hypothetical protein